MWSTEFSLNECSFCPPIVLYETMTVTATANSFRKIQSTSTLMHLEVYLIRNLYIVTRLHQFPHNFSQCQLNEINQKCTLAYRSFSNHIFDSVSPGFKSLYSTLKLCAKADLFCTLCVFFAYCNGTATLYLYIPMTA